MLRLPVVLQIVVWGGHIEVMLRLPVVSQTVVWWLRTPPQSSDQQHSPGTRPHGTPGPRGTRHPHGTRRDTRTPQGSPGTRAAVPQASRHTNDVTMWAQIMMTSRCEHIQWRVTWQHSMQCKISHAIKQKTRHANKNSLACKRLYYLW